jgi:hypothetical protein
MAQLCQDMYKSKGCMQLSLMDIMIGSQARQQDLNKILTLVPLLAAGIPWQVEKQPTTRMIW